ncbi:MAG: hypothetical protein PHD97_05345 [Bacteroidales bacterium]|nr:hypothetical protein [Bacteroidales bacterium]
MQKIIKFILTLLITLFMSFNFSFSQEINSGKQKFDKCFTAGLSSVVSSPYFLNVMPNVGYQLCNKNSNLGFVFNSEFLIRFRLNNYMALFLNAGAFKNLNREGKFPVNAGFNIGAGINKLYYAQFLTSAFVSIPVARKLKFKCQPTFVIPDIETSFISFSLVYCFSHSKK